MLEMWVGLVCLAKGALPGPCYAADTIRKEVFYTQKECESLLKTYLFSQVSCTSILVDLTKALPWNHANQR